MTGIGFGAVLAGAALTATPAGASTRHLPSGCRPRGPHYVTRAHTPRKLVALTFDDGPSRYTPALLRVLEQAHVNASFFVIGEQIRGNPGPLRRELRDGDMIGNHTWSHPSLLHVLPGQARSQLARTSAAIRTATGFRPCLWRPPYGDISGRLVRMGRSLGMIAVAWTIDTRDWAGPPSAQTIWSRAVLGRPGPRPGTIILMHDGGGNRSNTVAAVPRIIATLRKRGYRLVTLDRLLGIPRIVGK